MDGGRERGRGGGGWWVHQGPRGPGGMAAATLCGNGYRFDPLLPSPQFVRKRHASRDGRVSFPPFGELEIPKHSSRRTAIPSRCFRLGEGVQRAHFPSPRGGLFKSRMLSSSYTNHGSSTGNINQPNRIIGVVLWTSNLGRGTVIKGACVYTLA